MKEMTIMKFSRSVILIILLLLGFFILAVAFYPSMPETMTSHWNASGEADDTISKFWGLFLFPLISLAITALLLLILRIDPLKANIEKFKGYYYGFIITCWCIFFTSTS